MYFIYYKLFGRENGKTLDSYSEVKRLITALETSEEDFELLSVESCGDTHFRFSVGS